jgi:predicted ATPase
VFRDKLYQQTEGNPLFTVELLRTMQEQGSLAKDNEGRWVKGPELNWEIMPARMEAVISERIGRVPKKLQKVLALASVEGEDFTAEVAARVQEIDDLEMVQLLSEELDKRHRLVSAKGIRQLETQRMSIYRFRHILFQKYLYNNLDKVEKTHLHEKTGAVLESLYGEKAEEIAVQLARHFQEAGIAAKAVKYLLLAGNKAMQLSANEEAVAHFREGLELLKTLPASPERAQQELELQVALGAPLQALKGYGAPEVSQTYDRARELCQQIGETPQLFPVLFLLCSFYWARADHHAARKLSEQLFNLAQMVQEPVKTALAQWAQGLSLVYLGEFIPAKAHLEHVIALYDSKKNRSLAFLYGQDPGVSCLIWDSWVLWFLGYPDQAFKLSQKAIALARELDHPFTLAFVLGVASWFHYFRREFEASKELGEENIKIAAEKGFELFKAWAPASRGYTQIAEGQVEDGIAQVKQGLAAWKAMGAEMNRTHCLAWLAEAYVKSGQTKEGMATIVEAFDALEKTGERYYEPELHRLKGELLLQQGIEDIEVKVCFRQAIDVAREQSSKSLELRAAISMARLLQKMGNPGEARHLLGEIFGWFKEGLETPDLKEAKALLQELP